MIRKMVIECPVCGADIKARDNKNIWYDYNDVSYEYYVKAMCDKCEHFMLFKTDMSGKVIWSWDDTKDTEIRVNLKGE